MSVWSGADDAAVAAIVRRRRRGGSGLAFLMTPGGYFSSTPTFTRATTATYVDSGSLVASAASGILRSDHYAYAPTMALSYRSTLLEGARTNSALWSRDLTNAAWTTVTLTTAATVGADGGATSGTRLTATGANSTAMLAALVHALAARTGSFYLKRITGTGNVDITLDNGAAWTTVTLTAAYKQLSKTQTLANSQFGIRLVTSGDVVDVDYAQNEAGAFVSSPTPTTTVAVTRNADALSATFLPVPQAMTWYARFVDQGNSLFAGNYSPMSLAGDTPHPNLEFYTDGGGKYVWWHHNGTASVSKLTSVATAFGDLVELRGILYADGSIAVGQSINGAAEVVSTTSAANTLGAAWANTNLYIGSMNAANTTGFQAFTHIGIGLGPERSMAEMRARCGV